MFAAVFCTIRPAPAAAGDPPPTATLEAVLTPKLGLAERLRLKIGNMETVDPSKLRLILDDHLFADLQPQRRKSDEIAFDLSGLRADKTGGWLWLVGHPPIAGTKAVHVALSYNGGPDLDVSGSEKDPSFTLVIFASEDIFAGAVLVLVLVALVIRLATHTDALRDTSIPDPGGAAQHGAAGGSRRKFSLGRCQMAFWFTLISSCFIMLWLVTGDYNGIVSAQSLTLLGISGVTAISAASIDSAKPDTNDAAQTASKGFIRDVLTDSAGNIAFQRLQVAVWTILLGGIAAWSAYTKLALPTFDDNLLILMGVSSGLYVGFKFPEKPA